jgi:predicted MFS family arabinose efflux permease
LDKPSFVPLAQSLRQKAIGGLLGVFVASRFKSRHVLLTGFLLQFIALIALAFIGRQDIGMKETR